jgi:hypothetical protein
MLLSNSWRGDGMELKLLLRNGSIRRSKLQQTLDVQADEEAIEAEKNE